MTEDVIDRHYLTPLLAPASVAIVGATERKGAIGEVLIKNMLAARFEGELYAVNPKYRRVHGVRCFPALSRLPKRAELAVIATPPATVPGLLEDCGRAGIRAVIVITAGFGETGPAGKALEDEVLATARRYGIRVLGPNCLGVVRTDIGFNATFAMGGALPGSLALVSQSGALCTAMLDWARPHRVGFSSVVSLGGSSDIYFGEVIDFLAVEIHRDRAIALPPLNEFLVDELIDGTRSSRLLGAFRNLPPVDRQALRDVLLRLSEMVCELACLDELDINPLIIDEQGVVIADARVVVRALPGRPGQYRHMAIHPYPANLVESWRGRNGEMVTLRPIRPEDAEIEQEFVRGLSAESRHFRFMDTLRELTPSMLLRLTQIDYDREMAFIATVGRDNREVEIGVCRYVSNPDGRTCEFAIVVADDWQKQGLGRRMMDQLIAVARERGLSAMMGHVLRGNRGMLTLCERLGFREEVVQLDHSVVRLTFDLHTS